MERVENYFAIVMIISNFQELLKSDLNILSTLENVREKRNNVRKSKTADLFSRLS